MVSSYKRASALWFKDFQVMQGVSAPEHISLGILKFGGY